MAQRIAAPVPVALTATIGACAFSCNAMADCRERGERIPPVGLTRIGGYLIMAWLIAIAINLVTTGNPYGVI